MGLRDARRQIFQPILVHEEPDGATVHAVNADGAPYMLVHCLQHEAITTCAAAITWGKL